MSLAYNREGRERAGKWGGEVESVEWTVIREKEVRICQAKFTC